MVVLKRYQYDLLYIALRGSSAYQDNSCCSPHNNIEKRDQEDDGKGTEGDSSDPRHPAMRALNLAQKRFHAPFSIVNQTSRV